MGFSPSDIFSTGASGNSVAGEGLIGLAKKGAEFFGAKMPGSANPGGVGSGYKVSDQRKGTGVLAYPLGLGDENSTDSRYIKFTAHQYTGKGTPRNPEDNSVITPLSTIFLPVPPLKTDEQHSYSDFSSLSPLNPASVKTLQNSINSFMSGDMSGGASSAIKGIAQAYPAQLAKQVYGFINSSELGKNARKSVANGASINPMTTKIYESTNLRVFTFNWNMVARSFDEALSIWMIIWHFRELSRAKIGSSSEFLGDMLGEAAASKTGELLDQSTIVASHPSIWKVEFGSTKSYDLMNWALPKIKPSVISRVSVTYNNENQTPVFFLDGMPVEVSLEIEVSEMYQNFSGAG